MLDDISKTHKGDFFKGKCMLKHNETKDDGEKTKSTTVWPDTYLVQVHKNVAGLTLVCSTYYSDFLDEINPIALLRGIHSNEFEAYIGALIRP